MIKYRPEIDGLRAIAVLSVIFFHAGFPLFRGGYVGVDVFFVISGFLITSIVLFEFKNDQFSIVNFYEKRARRILPALFFVMAVCAPIAWIVLLPKDLDSFFKSLNAIPMFKANIFFWKDVDYFATASELKPFLHTWSLAVEEQYYLVFPIFVLLLGRSKGIKILFSVILFLAIASLIRSQVISSSKVSENFFLLPTRFWEIAIGSFIAFIPSRYSLISVEKRQWLSLAGIVFIFSSIFTFTKDTPFPSLYALVPTFGTFLVILFASVDTVVGKILKCKMLVQVGLISYSTYLWHQPVFAFSRYILNSKYLNNSTMFFLSLFSILLGALSWKFVELPFKNKIRFNRTFIFKFSSITSLFFIFFGYYFSLQFNNYGIETLVAKSLSLSEFAYFKGITDERTFVKERIRLNSETPEILIIGSSRIKGIDKIFEKKILGLGVSGASVEDDIAITYLSEQKFNPNTILIGVDPWLFNLKSNQDRWKSLEKEYLVATGRKKQDSISTYKISKVTEAIRHLYEISNISLQSIPENGKPEFQAKISSNGHHIYDLTVISKTQKEIESDFHNQLNYSMVEYVFSPSSKKEFLSLIKQQALKRKVILVLTPYHPKLYKRMVNEKPIFLKIENEFRQLAKENNIAIVGSYNPILVGCTAEEFYDGMHPKKECMEKVIKHNERD